MDLHALVRETERSWRKEAGIPLRGRGGSDGNTRQSLTMLVQFCDAVSEGAFTQGMRDLSRWVRGARMVLGDLERPRRLPHEVTCRKCGGKTLRMWMMEGIVRCVTPGCGMQGDLEFAEGEVRIAWDANESAAG
jgi:hypothetical protein